MIRGLDVLLEIITFVVTIMVIGVCLVGLLTFDWTITVFFSGVHKALFYVARKS